MNLNKQPKVGLVYDDSMTNYYHLWVPDYPECPNRLRVPLDRCNHYGLIERCLSLKPRKAVKEEILWRHSLEYFNLLEQTANMSEQELKKLSMKFDGVYFHPDSFNAAMMAAGCAIEAASHVLNEEVQSSFAFIRPPGHHAMRDEANGYCYFNNVALAASLALEKFKVKRVLIIDWDVHHGQGTQSLFYDDPRVLYFSCHRYEHGKFWPNLRQSDYDFIGEGKGKGFNINVPLNETGLKDGDYLAIFQQILVPVAYEYQPDLVLVSCGFDAAIGDPESLNHVTPACFAHLTHMVKEFCKKICFIFEGGYCIKSLSECMALTLRALLDDPCPQLLPLDPPSEGTQMSILNSIRVLRPFWNCFQFQLDGMPPFQLDMITPKDDITFSDISGPDTIYSLNVFERMSIEEAEKFDNEIEEVVKKTILSLPPNRTCLAYDDIMLQHKQISGHHPEQPERLKRVMKKLKESNLLERCRVVQSRKATLKELNLIHSVEYINEVRDWSQLSIGELDKMTQSDLFTVRSIYFNKVSYDCALLAVGCTLNVLDEVARGESRNGFAIVRPPGHHATRSQANGFCFFNTVSIAAKYCQLNYNLKRILILDWDIHHGNGTQEAFYSDPSVLVISIHRRDGGNFYPIGDDNSLNQVGDGEGIGFNVNIPWPRGSQGDAEYMAAFQQIIMPVAYEFGPDLILVSAGFDAALGDPLGGCNVSPEMYGHMTYMLSPLAGGRLVLILEGGYNLNAISTSTASCISALLGDPLQSLSMDPINERAAEIIRKVIGIQQKYWKSLKFQVNMPSRESTVEWLREQENKWELIKYEKHDTLKGPLMVTDQSHLAESTQPCTSVNHAAGNIAGGNAFMIDEELLIVFSDLALGEDILQLHAVVPLTWCPHLDCLIQPFTGSINTKSPCSECSNPLENWICLSCFEVCCSRFRNGHMVLHNYSTKHPLVLSFSDLSVWCYECQAYVDNQILRSFEEAAYFNKFNCQMP